MSNSPVSSFKKCARLIEARLHAVSSKNIYSEHGLLALMRPSAGHVCHSLIVVSYCKPGSALAHAERFISFQSWRAFTVRATFFDVRHVRSQLPSSITAFIKSFVT